MHGEPPRSSVDLEVQNFVIVLSTTDRLHTDDLGCELLPRFEIGSGDPQVSERAEHFPSFPWSSELQSRECHAMRSETITASSASSGCSA